MTKATGKPFNSKTGRAASLKSPWRKQQFCNTERAKRYRRLLDQKNANEGGNDA